MSFGVKMRDVAVYMLPRKCLECCFIFAGSMSLFLEFLIFDAEHILKEIGLTTF